MFPCSQGRFWDFENEGMIHAMWHWIGSGKIQVFSSLLLFPLPTTLSFFLYISPSLHAPVNGFMQFGNSVLWVPSYFPSLYHNSLHTSIWPLVIHPFLSIQEDERRPNQKNTQQLSPIENHLLSFISTSFRSFLSLFYISPLYLFYLFFISLLSLFSLPFLLFQVFCVDGIDAQSLFNKNASPQDRARRNREYYEAIMWDVAPYIRNLQPEV